MFTEKTMEMLKSLGLPVADGGMGTGLSGIMHAFSSNALACLHASSKYPPTLQEAKLLRTYFQYRAKKIYGDPNMIVTEGANTIIFIKGQDETRTGWYYRMSTWSQGPMFIPCEGQNWSLEELLDHVEDKKNLGNAKDWAVWKKKWPDGYTCEVHEEEFIVTEQGDMLVFSTVPPISKEIMRCPKTPENVARLVRMKSMMNLMGGFTLEDTQDHSISIHRRRRPEAYSKQELEWWADAIRTLTEDTKMIGVGTTENGSYEHEVRTGLIIKDVRAGDGSVTFSDGGYINFIRGGASIKDRTIKWSDVSLSGQNVIHSLTAQYDEYDPLKYDLWREAYNLQCYVIKKRPLLSTLVKKTVGAK
jgi:hypothetical protein